MSFAQPDGKERRKVSLAVFDDSVRKLRLGTWGNGFWERTIDACGHVTK